MAFTYTASDLATDDATKVRFYTGDNVEDIGILPDNANVQDAEIDALLTLEGDWKRAVAAVFDSASARHAKDSSFAVFNGQFSRSDVARAFANKAKEWRERWGLDANEFALLVDTAEYSDTLFSRDDFGNTD